MKKWKTLFIGMLSGLLLFTGCGKSYDAKTSTVYVLKDQKIVSVDVESFDETIYDKDDLERYVKENVEAYREDSVKFKELKVEEGQATLTMNYASAEDYTKFTGIELFCGSVMEALSRGYTFDTDFAAIADGKATACKVSEFLGNADLKVVIIKGNVNVNVPGTIVYASVQNAGIVDKSTIAVAEGTSLIDTLMDDVSGETETENVPTETTTGEPSGDEFLDEDDLLGTDEAATEVFFSFDDEEYQSSEEKSEFSEIYNYIIYK